MSAHNSKLGQRIRDCKEGPLGLRPWPVEPSAPTVTQVGSPALTRGGGGQANTGPCWVWGEVSGAAADNPDRIIVAVWGDRDQVSGQGRPGGSNYVLEVDGNGDLITRWTQWDTLFNTPHQVYISPYDPERAIYIIERGVRQRIRPS